MHCVTSTANSIHRNVPIEMVWGFAWVQCEAVLFFISACTPLLRVVRCTVVCTHWSEVWGLEVLTPCISCGWSSGQPSSVASTETVSRKDILKHMQNDSAHIILYGTVGWYVPAELSGEAFWLELGPGTSISSFSLPSNSARICKNAIRVHSGAQYAKARLEKAFT